MKNNGLKATASITILIGITMAIVMILSALNNKQGPIEEVKEVEIVEIKPVKEDVVDDVSVYELGKQMGQLEELTRQLEEKAKETPIPTPTQTTAPTPTLIPPTPQVIIVEVPQATPSQNNPTPTPIQTIIIVETPKPTPIMETTLELIDPQANQGLKLREGMIFVYHETDIIDNDEERGYVNLGLIVRDGNGDSMKDVDVKITGTDSSFNKEMDSTGNIRKIVKPDGSTETVHYYPFHYEFRSVGDHTLTFEAEGKTKSITIEGVVEASQ